MGVVLLFSSTCGAAEGKAKVTLVLPRSIEVLDDPHMVVAQEMGYFDEEGIEFVLEQAYGVNDCKMVATGQADIAIPSPYIYLKSVEEGLPIISFAQLDQINIFCFAVRPDSNIKTFEDLKGKTIVLGDPAWAMISNPILIAAGLDPNKDITYVTGGEGRAQLVAEGKADAVLTWEKEYQLWEAQGLKFNYLFGRDVLDIVGNTFVARIDDLKDPKRAEVLARAVRAIAKGLYFVKLNPEAATEMTLRKYPSIKVPFKDAIRAVKAATFITYHPVVETEGWCYQRPDGWKRTIEIGVRSGNLTKEIPLERAFTNEWIKFINDWDRKKVEEDAKNYKVTMN
jgi:ABC-type nitrate/sulfonate/bicarbonate transport system substrate-binding protein